MLITDHINLLGMTGRNPLVGPNDSTLGPRFPDMSAAYDPALRELALRVAARLGQTVQQGVYCCLSGPTFETPAELRFLKTIGADAVGMSTAPEVVVARHCGMRVLGFSAISNVHDIEHGTPTSHEEVLAAGKTIGPKVSALIAAILGEIARSHPAQHA
jgi:purine-nucleoside phosphorylase